MEENKQRNYSLSIMTKNVTQFKHLLKNPFATQHDVTWAINLRQYATSPSKNFKQSNPPEVYHKKTKISEIRQQQFLKSKQKPFNKWKYNQYSHMAPIFKQKQLKHTATAIQFFSSLRNANRKKQDKQNQSQFSTIPFKDRNQRPRLLKKNNIKKTSRIQKDDLESADDGRQNYPHYNQNILRTKNYSLLKDFTHVNRRQRVNLPGLAWQIGLRNY